MRPTLRALMPALLGMGAGVAAAEPADASALRLASLAATCAQCHGTEGRAPAGALAPALAGRPEALLRERLDEFRAGTRAATVMTQLARGYQEAQLRRLAAYFAARSP
jgi:cytochrome c553